MELSASYIPTVEKFLKELEVFEFDEVRVGITAIQGVYRQDKKLEYHVVFNISISEQRLKCYIFPHYPNGDINPEWVIAMFFATYEEIRYLQNQGNPILYMLVERVRIWINEFEDRISSKSEMALEDAIASLNGVTE